MNVTYFRDTDTALLEFFDHAGAETREINENLYVDRDVDGKLVSMTIEHAKRDISLPDVVVQQIGNEAQRP